MQTRSHARAEAERARAEEARRAAEAEEVRNRTLAFTPEQRVRLDDCLRDFGRRVLPSNEPFDPRRMVRVELRDVSLSDPPHSYIHLALAILERVPRGIPGVRAVEIPPGSDRYVICLFVREDLSV